MIECLPSIKLPQSKFCFKTKNGYSPMVLPFKPYFKIETSVWRYLDICLDPVVCFYMLCLPGILAVLFSVCVCVYVCFLPITLCFVHMNNLLFTSNMFFLVLSLKFSPSIFNLKCQQHWFYLDWMEPIFHKLNLFQKSTRY